MDKTVFRIEAPLERNGWKAAGEYTLPDGSRADMRMILRAKVNQHEYVRRKLLETGDRELVENSWRDDFWGWGPHRDGQNMLGKLWMEVRSELRYPCGHVKGSGEFCAECY